MSTLACSGQSSTAAGKGRVVSDVDKRIVGRETRFGLGNWFLRQENEEGRAAGGGGVRTPLMGRVPVPAGLAMAMALSLKGQGMKMRERSLSGMTLVEEERNEVRVERLAKSRSATNRWLVLC